VAKPVKGMLFLIFAKPRTLQGILKDNMRNIGKYFDRQIYWLDYDNITDQLPDKDWVWLAISTIELDIDTFDKFVRTSIAKNILKLKGHGKFGEKLHDIFDETIVEMDVIEKHPEIGVMTTCHNYETLADIFWQCFFTTYLPETADFYNIKIVFVDLDGTNRTEELQSYLKEFELGWLPSDNIKHEVWKDPEG